MSDPRPGELSRIEAKKLAEEMAALLGLAEDERKYREHVLVTLARMEVKQDSLGESQGADDEFFDHVRAKGSTWTPRSPMTTTRTRTAACRR